MFSPVQPNGDDEDDTVLSPNDNGEDDDGGDDGVLSRNTLRLLAPALPM